MRQFTVPFQVLEQPEFKLMTVDARLLYFYLAKYKSQCIGVDFPKYIPELLRDTGLTINRFNKAEKELLERGFIKITKEIMQIDTESYSFIDSKGKKLKLSLV